MEIEEESQVKSILKLIEQQLFSESVVRLLQIERVSPKELEYFVDCAILKHIFQHYIKEIEVIENKMIKHSESHIMQYQNLLAVLDRLVLIGDKKLGTLMVKSNVKDLVSKLVNVKHISLNIKVFFTIASLAKIIPELFQTQFILILQRSLLEKSSNPAQRLEYFLLIFYNLIESSTAYQIDAYFYINFLKMQFQNTRLTRQSLIYVIETLEHLIRYEENTENTTIKNVFEVVTEQMYPRLSLDYNICSRNIEECDTDIQLKFLQLMNLFIVYDYKPISVFISQNISEIKNILFNVKRRRIPLVNIGITLELVNYSISSSGEESLVTIDHLLFWDSFQKVLDDLTADSKRMNQSQSDLFAARKIKQHVCDMLISMLNKNHEHIYDYFINEYLVGQLVDLSTFLDSKRRQIGIEQVVKVLKYLKKQSPEKFVFDNENKNHIIDESKETDELDEEFAIYKSNKIILNSLSDLFEVASLPYDTNKIIPSYYIKMQQLSNKVKIKMSKQFGDKLPKSLREYVDQYEQTENNQEKKRQKSEGQRNQDDWEDISDENEEAQSINLNTTTLTINGFNVLDYEFMDESEEEDNQNSF